MANNEEKDNRESGEAAEERTRTVLDFSSDVDLKQALSEAIKGGKNAPTLNPAGDSTSERKMGSVMVGCLGSHDDPQDARNAASGMNDTEFDWVLTNYDENTTEAQSMEEELHRLLVLKSYLILDSEREEAFERLTSLGARMFNVPICLVSLVDLGRQWFMSNKGLGLCRETNRRVAFCAHAIQLKSGLKTLVVPDAKEDFRFKDSPLVLGPPFIRFYAGAPLLSPEGFKLGTFCIISPEPRPHGLSADEEESLIDMANLTVKIMVDRRARLENREDPARLIAYTSHDLMTPLGGVQLALSLLSEDDELLSKLDSHQNELLSTATNCSDIMIRICKSSMDSLRSIRSSSKKALYEKQNAGEKVTRKVAKMAELVKSLQVIVEPIPKQVPLVITLSPNVPNQLLSDDLKIFRSALNLVKDAILRTETGKVHLRIFRQEQEGSEISDSTELKKYLTFECEDSGLDIPIGEVPFLFEASSETSQARLGLHSIANLIKSLDGTFGYRKRGENISGSIFWFSVPLILADTQEDDSVHSFCFSINSNTSGLHFQRRGSTNPLESASLIRRAASNVSLNSLSSEEGETGTRTRRALIIDDSVIVRKTIVRALTKLGFEVDQAENGSEGLNCMKQTLFDIVFCDFLMPVMDGLDCVKQYREWENEERPFFRQYIVGISAHVGVEESGQGLEAGMNAFRPKPISMKNLTELQESEPVRRIMKQLDKMKGNSFCTPRETSSSCNSDGGALPPPPLEVPATNNRKMDLDIRDETRFALVLSGESCECFEKMKADGWQIVFSPNFEDVERQLRKRNWDLVLIDEEMPSFSAPRLISNFREWEAANRVNEQKNVLFVSGSDLPRPSDKYSIVRPPSGFNGVLRKPIEWEDIDHLLHRSKNHLSILVPK